MSGRHLERCSWFDDNGVKIPYTPGCKLGRIGKCQDIHPEHPDWARATRTKNMARPWPGINDFDGNPLYSKEEAAKKIPLEAQKKTWDGTWDKWDLGKPKSKKKKSKTFGYRPFSLSPSQRSPSPEMARYHDYESRRDRDRERSRSPRRRDSGWGPRRRPEERTREDDDDMRGRMRSDDMDKRRPDDDKRDRRRSRWDEPRRAGTPEVRKDVELQENEQKPSDKALGKRRAMSPAFSMSLSSDQSPKVPSSLTTDNQLISLVSLSTNSLPQATPQPTSPIHELSTYQIPSLPVLSGDVHQQRITLLLHIFKLRADLEALRGDRARYADDMRTQYGSGTSDFILPSVHRDNAQLALRTRQLEQAIATTETALFALPDTQPASISPANFHLNQVELMKFFDQAEAWLKAIELVRVDIREALEIHATTSTPGQPSLAPLKLRAWPEIPSLGHYNRRLGDYQGKVLEFQNEVEEIQRTDVGDTFANALQRSTAAQQLINGDRPPADHSIEDRLGSLENGVGALIPNDVRALIDAKEKKLEVARIQQQEMMQMKAVIQEKLNALEQKALERKSALRDLREQIIRLHELREPAPERILKPLMEALVDQEVTSIRKAVDVLNSFSKQAAERSAEEMQARVNKELEPAMRKVRTIRATAHSMQYNRQ